MAYSILLLTSLKIMLSWFFNTATGHILMIVKVKSINLRANDTCTLGHPVDAWFVLIKESWVEQSPWTSSVRYCGAERVNVFHISTFKICSKVSPCKQSINHHIGPVSPQYNSYIDTLYTCQLELRPCSYYSFWDHLVAVFTSTIAAR